MDTNISDLLITSCIGFFIIGFIFLTFFLAISSNESYCKEYSLEYNFTYKEIKYNSDMIILPNNKNVSCWNFVDEIQKKQLESSHDEKKSKIEDLRGYIK